MGALPAFLYEEMMNETQLWELLERYLAAEGLELDDLEWAGPVLRVTIDAEEGVDVERIAETARSLSRLLDHEGELTGAYTLEVSSPGLERKLRRPAHFTKAVGREVKIRTKKDIDGARNHRGLLEAFDDGVCVVVIDGKRRKVSIDDIGSAKTVFHWNRGAKPGGKRREEASR